MIKVIERDNRLEEEWMERDLSSGKWSKKEEAGGSDYFR